jgi:hypothetical protein
VASIQRIQFSEHWQMLAVLLGRSLCNFCAHTVQVTDTQPHYFSYRAFDGDIVCINSTAPYLAVVFEHTSLLSVRYFIAHTSAPRKLIRAGRFVFPSESTGVTFEAVYGHIEARVLIPSTVSGAVFAYPRDCGTNRYLTTGVDDQLILGTARDANFPRVCLWSPHANYTLIQATDDSLTNPTYICETGSDCVPAPEARAVRGNRLIGVRRGAFVMMDSASKHGFVVGVHVKRGGRFMRTSGKLANGRDAALIEVAKRTEPEGERAPQNRPVVGLREPAHLIPDVFPVRHGPHRQTNFLSAFEVFSVLCVGIAVIMFILQCYVCPHNRRKTVRDDSEQVLLGTRDSAGLSVQPQEYSYPQGYASGAPWQYQIPPMYAYFPNAQPD